MALLGLEAVTEDGLSPLRNKEQDKRQRRDVWLAEPILGDKV